MTTYIGNKPSGAKDYVTDTPIGSIMAWAKATLPLGWIECNGQSTAPYPDLATIVGANVPDLRGEFIRGVDNGRGVDAGRILGSSQADELKSHRHTYDQAFVTDAIKYTAGTVWGGNNVGAKTGFTGGDETRPRNVALIYIIRAFDVIKDEVGAIVLPANENFIINGNMDINTRGDTAGAVLSGGALQYRADRFPCYADHNGTVSFNRVNGGTNVPPINELGYQAGASSQFYIDVADTSVTGTNEIDLLYYMEGYDWAKNVKGNTTTLTFWVQSNAVGTYSVGFRNSTFDRTFIASYTVDAVDVWQKVTIVLPYDSVGTWASESNAKALVINWNFMSAPVYQTSTLGQWQAGNFISAVGSRNLMDTAGNYARISAVKMEVGDRSTAQTQVDRATEIVKCQRYCQKYTAEDYAYQNFCDATARSAGEFRGTMHLTNEMRARPTVTLGGSQRLIGVSGSIAISNANIQSLTAGGRKAVTVLSNGNTGLVAGQGYQLSANNDLTAYWLFNAELS